MCFILTCARAVSLYKEGDTVRVGVVMLFFERARVRYFRQKEVLDF